MSDRQRDYDEKRDFIRMQLNSEAQLLVNGQQIEAVCIDLSSSGMQLKCAEPLTVGTSVEVTIGSRHSQLSGLAATATVVRCEAAGDSEAYQIGLQIVQMK